ncbi:MAG TPA: hypothetical protein VK338_06060 [Candidatus Nitrosocosmicus sp.]|nr:hypothetical protein [Candidatus Nitrosocosmicus sp.]
MPRKNHTPIHYLINSTAIDINSIPNQEPIAQQVSSPSKESAPIINKPTEVIQMHEVVEHKIEDPEVHPHVEVRPHTVQVPEELQNIGVQQTATPSAFQSVQTITLPISDEKVYKGLHEPVYSSIRWLSEFCVYLLAHAHTSIKSVHGKITRVTKR